MSNLTQSTVNRLKSIKLLFSAALTMLMICYAGVNVSAQDKIPFGSNDTLEEIQAKIQLNGYSFEVGHNWVFDLTPEEKAKMFPARRAPAPGSNIPTPNTDLILKQNTSALPLKLDWRNKDGHSYIGPIRNQGKSCACVTFGCTDAASLSYNVKYGLYDENCAAFSVMYFLWTLGPAPQYGDFGYAAGSAEYTQFYALMKTGGTLGAAGFEGAISEANFPFVDSGVAPTPDVIERSKTYPRVTFKNWIRIMPVNYADTTEQIKAAILAHGSVAVQVDHCAAFLAYKSGVYQDTNTLPDAIPYYQSRTGHGVSLVGWDDNPPEGGGGCWILRNEWGTGWGEGGYMRIRYFSAMVNTTAACVVAGASPGQYAIRGNVKGPVYVGVNMFLAGSDTSSIMTGTNSNYALGNLVAGTYTVTPSYPGYSFEPSSRTVTLPFGIDGNFNECNFTSRMTGPLLMIGVSPENKGNTYPPVGQAAFQKDQWTLLYTKSADVCYAFKEWNIVGDAELKYDKSVAVNEVRLAANASATAVFEYKGPPDHVDMTISPYDHGTGTVTPAEGTYPVGYNVPVSIDASPAAGRYFAYWKVYAGYEGNATVKDPYQHATTATLTGNARICAYFYSIKKEVQLAMAASPIDAGFTNPFSGSTTIVPGGSHVDIEAIPADGYYFDKWTVSVEEAYAKFNNVHNSKTQIVLQNNAEVKANFKKIEKTASLALAVSPDNSGTINPAVGTHTVPVGAHTEIEALPADGYFFVNWTVAGSAQVDDLYSDKTLVVLSDNSTVTANFAKIVNTATLMMSVSPYSPFNPESSTNPGEGDHVVPAGAWTDIEAFPAEGWFFDKWTLEGGADIVDVFARETYVSLNANATVTANFKPIEATAMLTLVVAPDGSGSTNPSTGEQTVIVGEHIEIEAIPEEGYSFKNWTVSGGATVTGSAESGWMATLTTDGTVTANFMPENGAWVNITGNVPGANRVVYAFDGDSDGNVYVGGLFSVVGGLSTNAVARLSLSTGEWSDVGGGMKDGFSIPPSVKTFARDAAGNLYIGGSFRIPGDEILSPCDVAKWDGMRWTRILSLPSGQGVNALACDSSGNLYVGGTFDMVDGESANNIAKWDGKRWSALGDGADNDIDAISCDARGNLYASGDFDNVDGIPANKVAVWDGSKWSALGSGISGGKARVIKCDNAGKLYAGGDFSEAGGVMARSVAVWNGSKWSALGSWLEKGSSIYALDMDSSGKIYVAGSIAHDGQKTVKDVAVWNGISWSALGAEANDWINALIVTGNDTLLIGGSFSVVGGLPAQSIAKWDSSGWHALNAGTNGACNASADDAKGSLYFGGAFTEVNGINANHVAKWTGTNWSALGLGLNNSVEALAVDAKGNLFAGGYFTKAGGVDAAHVAVWNGSVWSPLGKGLDGYVLCLAFDAAGNLYVGGRFRKAGDAEANCIAKWDGTTWTALGQGTDMDVSGITCASDGKVYVAGGFNKAGGADARHVAVWDGSEWAPLGAGFAENLHFKYCIASDAKNNIYVGGGFPVTMEELKVNCIAMWDGSKWGALDSGIDDGGVDSLAFDALGRLCVGGDFTSVSGVKASKLAVWDGTKWLNPFAAGLDNAVFSILPTSSGDLYAGGYQSMAGGLISPYISKWNNSATSHTLTVNSGSGSGSYSQGASVKIEAARMDGQVFDKWTGDAAYVKNVNASFTTVAIPSKDITVTASYRTGMYHNVYFNAGNNGLLEGGVKQIKQTVIAGGSCSPVLAVPDDGYVFAGWSGSITSNENPLVVTNVTGEMSITATFSKIGSLATLTMSVNPSEGGATEPAIGAHGGTPTGQEFPVKAIPAAGYLFAGWAASGGAKVAVVSAPETTGILSADGTITANFLKLASTATLTMAVSPSDGGSVTPEAGEHGGIPLGIPFNVAATANSGYLFTGWSVSDKVSVVDPGSDSTEAIMVGDATVTANFAKLTGEWVWQKKILADSPHASHHLAAISGDGKTLFVGGYQANLLMSKDAGASWLTMFPPGGDWTSVSCSGDAQVVVGTFVPGTVNISTDGGTTWSADAPEEKPEDWTSSAVSSDGSIIYIGHSSGSVYKKIAGTAEWTKLDLPNTEDVPCMVLRCSADGRTVLAGQYKGVLLLSKDAGATWSPVDLNDGKTAEWWEGWVSGDGKTILVSAGSGPLNASFDAGLTWQEFFGELENLHISGLGGAEDASLLVASTDQGVYIHNAGGTDFSWTKVDVPGDYYAHVACSKTAKMIFLGADYNGLACISRNYGADWSNMDFGNNWLSASSSVDGGCQIVTGQDHVMYSNDQGESWNDVRPTEGKWSLCSISADGKKLAAAKNYGSLHVSADAGANWTECTGIDPKESWGGLAMTPNAEVLFAAGFPDFIHKSEDFGVTWKTLYPVDEETALYWGAIACDSSGKKVLAAAFKNSIYQSLDGGSTWKEIDVGGGATLEWNGACSSSDGKILALSARKDKFYISRDGGENWTACSPTGENGDWFGVSCSADGKVIAATDRNDMRYYISMDSGMTWKDQAAYPVKYIFPFVSANGRCVGSGVFGGNYYFAELVDAPIDVNIAMTGEGVLYPAVGHYWKKPKQTTVLNAYPLDNDYCFDSWTASGGAVVDEPFHQETAVTFFGDATVTANFAKITRAVTLTMAADPAEGGSTAPSIGEHAGTPIGKPVPIKATVADGYFFNGWITSEKASVANQYAEETVVILSGDATVTATFSKIGSLATLTMSANPSEGGTTEPAIGEHSARPIGQTFPIKAIPAAGYLFSGWSASGGAKVAVVSAPETTGILSADGTITANFMKLVSTATLTMAVSPSAGGNVTPDAGEHGGTPVGIPFNVAAVANSGYLFTGWSISENVSVVDPSMDSTEAILFGDATLTANFAPVVTPATLTMAAAPENSGSTNPAIGAHLVALGDTIEIGAVPASGYIFEKWISTGGAKLKDPYENSTSLVLSGDATVTANFTKLKGEWVWQEKTLADSPRASHSVAAISGDGKTVFVGGYEVNLHMSKDAGASWMNIYPPGGVWTSVSCSKDARVVVGTFSRGTVDISTDGGATWSEDPPEEKPEDWFSSAVSSDGSIIYIGHESGSVYKKIAGAAEWTKLDLPNTEDVACMVLRCSSDGMTVLAGQYKGVLLLSKDAGATWSPVDLNDGKTAEWWEGWVSGDGKTILVSALTGSLNASFDGGLTWQKFFGELKDLYISGLSGAEDASLLVASTNQGVYIHNAGGTDFSWTKVDVPGNTSNYAKVACSKTAKMIFLAADYNGVACISRNYGADWSNMDFGNNWLSAASSFDGGCQIVSGQDHIMYSNDQGESWKDLKPTEGTWPICSISADGKKLAAVMKYGSLHVSADAGANWTECTGIDPNQSWGGLAITPNAEVLFAAGYPDFIHKSEDFGATWKTLYPVDEETKLYWGAIACDSTGEKILAAAFKENIYQSLDGGATWKDLDVAGGAMLEWNGACSSSDGKILALSARKDKFYISRDGGENWTACSPTGENGDWYGVSCSADGKVIAATDRNDMRYYISMDSGLTWKDQTAYPVKYIYPFVSGNGRCTGAGVFGGKYYFAELVDAPCDVTIAMTGEGSMYPAVGHYWKKSGQKTVLNAFPLDNDYYFSSWTVSGGAVVEDPFSQDTSVTVSGDAAVTANFAKILSTAALTLAVTPRNSGSTNPGCGLHLVPVGAHTEIKAIPAAGYYFEKWTVSGGAKVTGSAESGWKATLTAKGTVTAKFTYFKDATVTSDTYAVGTVGGSSRTIAAVPSGTAKAVFLANLAKGQADQTWNDKGIANPVVSGNTLVVTAADKRTKITYKVYDFTVNASAGTGGSISPAGELPVNYNASKSFKMTPDSRHNMQNVVVDGETVGPVRNYTFKNVTENHTILAIFAIKTFTLTYNTTPNGAPIPAQTVNYGADGTTVTAVPNPGYRFVKWSDGVRTASRTDTDIAANKTVTANFAVGKIPATVTLADLSQVYNGTSRQVTAATVPAGLKVNIKYNGSANAPVNAGSYPVTATVVDDIYAGVQTGTLVISKGGQTIIFEPLPDKVCGAANFAPGATASSGLTVTYASSNTDVAKIVGSRIHITGAGTSVITAMQDGNANWNAAPEVSQPLTVAPNAPTYPIAADVYTTLEKTLVPLPLPKDPKPLLPCEVSEYAVNGYGLLNPEGGPAPFVRPDMQTNAVIPSVRDPLAATLLTFFSLSDTHLTDKESPAQCIYYGYEAGPLSNSSAYSAIILYTTHVLDAAIQTINVLNKRTPFDFGIDLGDAVNNNQYNELRWFIDAVDGQKITPSSGAHIGGKTIDYQKPYQAAGLDKSINWYQVMGNHDPFWTGCLIADDYIKETIVSSSVLNLGSSSATYAALDLRGFYMGLVDGSTKYGDIIDVGPVEYYLKPPKVVADRDRRSLSVRDWMGEFLNSTTLPAGHGITQEMIDDGLVRYSFHPRSDIPLKVIVLDDIDKGGSANGTLDYQRYDWLVSELDAGEAAGELMIVCAHIPVRPYAPPSPPAPPPTNNPYYPYYSLFATYSMISEEALLQKLWTYQNLIMWVSGHVHRNAITNQPPAAPTPSVPSPFYGDLTHAFWEVETPSLRDFPQQFRHFEIVRNSDNNISIFALDVDPAVKPPAEVGASAPAWTSRSYALACHQIYQVPVQQGPNVNPVTGVYNAELVKQLSPAMQAKLALLFPNVSSLKINGNASSTTSQTVTLNNTVSGTTPTQYMASESSDFSGAAWLPYSNAPVFILSSGAGTKTVHLKVKDGSGTESGFASASIVLK
jgi:metallophosphoesterase (TIGR03768 family)